MTVTRILALSATLAFTGPSSVWSETLTFSSGFVVSVDTPFALAPSVNVGESSFSIQGFDPAFGSLNSVEQEARSFYQYTDTATGLFGEGTRYGTGASQVFYTPSFAQDERQAFTTQPSIGTLYQDAQTVEGAAEGVTQTRSGTLSPTVLAVPPDSGAVADDYITSGMVGIQTWAQLGALQNVATNNSGSVTGAYRVTYDFTPSEGYDPAPVVVSPDTEELFDNVLVSSPTQQIGGATVVDGTATVISPDGTRRDLRLGDPISLGDVIETDSDTSVVVRFVDGSEFPIPSSEEGSRFTIDEYVFDPAEPEESPFIEYLRDRAARDELDGRIPCYATDESTTGGCGSIGFRADAADQIDPATRGTFASPVTLVAPVDVPTDPFALSFDYVFLDGAGTLDLLLGGTSIFSSTSDSSFAGLIQTASLLVDDPYFFDLGFDELRFTFEGSTGETFLLDNVVFPGLVNGSFDQLDRGWFVEGPGTVDLVGLIDADLLDSEPSPVPLPASAWFLLAALGFMAATRMGEGQKPPV